MANKKFVTFLHAALSLAQVGAAVAFVRLELLPLAILAALAGKWRVASHNPHRLLRNLRANSCDIIVIIAAVLSMDFYRERAAILIAFAIFLAVWLLFIKPATGRFAIALQAACCQYLGLSALWLNGLEQGLPGVVAVVLAMLISLSAARHLSSVLADEDSPERTIIPLIWALLIGQLAWLASIWSIIYRLPGDFLVPQIALLSTVLGYFGVHHMFTHADKRRLPGNFLWQQVFFCLAIVVAIIVLTPWTS